MVESREFEFMAGAFLWREACASYRSRRQEILRCRHAVASEDRIEAQIIPAIQDDLLIASSMVRFLLPHIRTCKGADRARRNFLARSSFCSRQERACKTMAARASN